MNPKRLRHIRDVKQVKTKGDLFLEEVTDILGYGDVDKAVCFIKHKSGDTYFVTSDGNTDEVIGMIEVGKSALINQRFEDLEERDLISFVAYVSHLS